MLSYLIIFNNIYELWSMTMNPYDFSKCSKLFDMPIYLIHGSDIYQTVYPNLNKHTIFNMSLNGL